MGQNRKPPTSDSSSSNRSKKLLGTHPPNWFPKRPSPIRLARLPNSGGISPLNRFRLSHRVLRLARLPNSGGISPLNWFSLRSRDSQVGEVAQLRGYLPAQLVLEEGQRLSGWRGCPTPAVSPRSTRFRRSPNPCQVGEVAQLRRYLPPQLDSRLRLRYVRLARLPNSGGISPLNWFPQEGQRFSGWRGCPTPAVSPRSTGSLWRCQIVPGWRGCPTPAESLRVNWLSPEEQPCPGWRGCPTPEVSPRSTGSRVSFSSMTRPLPSVVTPSHSLIGSKLSQL